MIGPDTAPGTLVRTVRVSYWYQAVPAGTEGVVVSVGQRVGSGWDVTIDAELLGEPRRLTVNSGDIELVEERD